MAVLWPFLVICANYWNIFHKTEVQMVILRCWTGLNQKVLTQMQNNANNTKNAKNITQMSFFLQYHKNPETEIFAFCVINFEPIGIKTCLAPQNDRLNLSFVKDIHVVGKKWPEVVLKRPFSIRKFWESPGSQSPSRYLLFCCLFGNHPLIVGEEHRQVN